MQQDKIIIQYIRAWGYNVWFGIYLTGFLLAIMYYISVNIFIITIAMLFLIYVIFSFWMGLKVWNKLNKMVENE